MAIKKLANRLTATECCFLTRKLVKHLDAMGRAKSMPKTKCYVLDTDAAEDPGLVHEHNDNDAEFDGALDDSTDPGLDGQIKLKAGDAPQKVYRPLKADARSKALASHEQKVTKFVRDMVAASLLPLTDTSDKLQVASEQQPSTNDLQTPSTRREQVRAT